MTLLDAWAIVAARTLPHRLVAVFDVITDFGKSNWFLWPIGLTLLAIALCWLRRHCRASPGSRLPLCRCNSSFLFFAIATAEPRCLHRQAADRARPAIRRRQRRSLSLRAVRLEGRIRQHAVRPCHHRVCGGGRDRRAVAADPLFMWAYALVIALSRVVADGPPSERRAGRRPGRGAGGAPGAAVVRGAPARLRDRARRAASGRCRALVPAHQKGCPAACRPIRSTRNRLPAAERGGDHERNARQRRRPAVSIVIPVKNEAGNITPLVTEIVEALGKTLSFEVIYVNDGSTDNTDAELTLLMASRPWLRHIRHATSCGQSAAVRTGVRYARAPLVATLDGDGQNDPKFIPVMLKAMAAGAPRVGLVAGQRTGRKATGFKKLQSRIANSVRGACCATAPATPAAASRRSAATSFSRCRISTGLHRFLPALVRREGYDVGLCRRGRPACVSTASRTTACGTGCGSASSICSACGGSSAAGARCRMCWR